MENNKAEQILLEVTKALQMLEEGKTLHDVMRDSTVTGPLFQQTIFTICRHYEKICWILKADNDKIRPRHRRLCCWVLCQYLYLSSMPAQKAVSIAIDVANKLWHKKEAGFINFLLRKIVAVSKDEWFKIINQKAPPWVKYDLSEPLWLEWKAQFTEEQIVSFAEILEHPVKTTLRIRQGYTLNETLQQQLKLLPSFFWAPKIPMWEIDKSELFFKHSDFDTTAVYCQDPTTLAAPVLLDAQPGEVIADLCCAPGGKTAIIAENMQGKGFLWCCDRSEKRLLTARKNLENYGELCHFLVQDATKSTIEKNSLDGILLDVPCSNSGVLRRHPDVRFHYLLKNVQELVLLQAEILENAVNLLKINGRMVYSTCSINQTENHQQIQQFLLKHPQFILEKELQIYPTLEHDGGYAAKLVKCGE